MQEHENAAIGQMEGIAIGLDFIDRGEAAIAVRDFIKMYIAKDSELVQAIHEFDLIHDDSDEEKVDKEYNEQDDIDKESHVS